MHSSICFSPLITTVIIENKIFIFRKSKKILKTLKFNSKLDLLNYEIEDIKIGDLIYDA